MQTILVDARNAPEQDKAFVEHLQAWEVENFDKGVYAYFALLNERRRTYRFVACFDGEVAIFQRSVAHFRMIRHKPSLLRRLLLNLGMKAWFRFPTSLPDMRDVPAVPETDRQSVS